MAIGLNRGVQRIFLVEDSPVILESLIGMLTSDDTREVVGVADTEDEAMERIGRADADVAIIDINLREGSGIGVLARLSRTDAPPALRIVYTSHYSNRIREQCARLGATHVLSKAGDFNELLEVLDEPVLDESPH